MKVVSRWAPGIVLVIAGLILVSGLFFQSSRFVTYDGHIHITTIAQFTQALKDGEFPVSWSDGFGSYGLPLPFIAHQTTSYLGAFITLLTNNVVLSYSLLFAFSAITSTTLFFIFMKRHFSADVALVAALLFNFAPYRIINIYIRGALPEFFASTLMLVVLLGLGWYFKDRRVIGLWAIIVGVALLALTHPMMVVIGAFLCIPYFLYLILPIKSRKELMIDLATLATTLLLGLGLAAYYVVPLLLEMKYLYQGLYPAPFLNDKFLSLENFINPNWYYYYTHPGPRGHFIQFGLLESCITLLGVGWIGLNWRSVFRHKSLGLFALVALAPLLFLVSPASLWLYERVFFLESLQFPWRMLSSLIFLPPIFLAVLLNKYRFAWLGLGVVVIVVLSRFPQLYGKNFIQYPQQNYYFNPMNLHGQNMTPIWAGNAQEYEIKPQQADIIEGTGQILYWEVKNATRTYQVVAETPLRLVDYTFYFPGWRVRVNGQEVPIEFQDVNYRGVITFRLPAGEQTVTLRYEATRVRWLGRAITVATGVSLGVLYVIWRSPLFRQLLPIDHRPVNRRRT